MKNLKITVNGTAYDVQVEESDGTPVVQSVAPAKKAAQPAAKAAPMAAPAAGETINCPMPGTIVSVNVTVGQKVSKGDVLVILEAMKMENEIMAPKDCTVTGISVNKGDSVDSGTALLTIQ